LKIAAIDIGSNAVRLQIARTGDAGSKDGIKRIEFVRIPIRLGDDAFQKKKITKEKRKVLYQALGAFKLILDAYGVEQYLACATSALREAKNRDKVVSKVFSKTGIKIEIIDGKRESELILKSTVEYLINDKNYLVIDVGGGSTEMTVIKNQQAINSISFDIGTVRLFDGEVKEKAWNTIEHWVKHKTQNIPDLIAVVTSGTINKIAKLINDNGNDFTFTRQQLEVFYSKVSVMPVYERIEKLKLNPDRADIIDASADIYLKILNWANIDEVFAPSAGLKDGILIELSERFPE